MCENSRLEQLLDPSCSITECLEKTKDSILFDIGVPLEFGGDPGPAGSTVMMKCGLAEGLGINLPFANYFARHNASIETGNF
jgi:hypothetical protein